MDLLTEQLFNLFDSILLTGLLVLYFGFKSTHDPKLAAIISIFVIFLFSNIVTYLPWTYTLIVYGAVLFVLSQMFFQGKTSEHILMSIIANIALAAISICTTTLISKLLDIDYAVILRESNLYRFFAGMTTKVLFAAFAAVLISIKKRLVFMLHKAECIFVSATLVTSFVLIAFVRNIIYVSDSNYGEFLVVLMCVIIINVIQFFTIIYISKKNIDEQNLIAMKSQLEMQEENLRHLEEKYDETARFRHDMKNHIVNAITMAEQTENEALIKYLKELTEEKLIPSDSYIKTNRKIINAVINAKSELAKNLNISFHSIIMDEMENISDVDIGIILGNLLDNSLDACQKNKGDSEIILKMWCEAGYYCIEVDNTAEYDVLSENPGLITSKADKRKHGLGLKSVRAIVDKYEGMMNYAQKGGNFCVYLSLCRYINR